MISVTFPAAMLVRSLYTNELMRGYMAHAYDLRVQSVSSYYFIFFLLHPDKITLSFICIR
jgi:hypothetical protein